MTPRFEISIIKTRKIIAESWFDAEEEALIWSIDEKASGHGVSTLDEESGAPTP